MIFNRLQRRAARNNVLYQALVQDLIDSGCIDATKGNNLLNYGPEGPPAVVVPPPIQTTAATLKGDK